MNSGESAFNFRNIVILIGIILTAVGLIYFASVFIDRISDLGRVLSMLFLTVLFVSLGFHFEATPENEPQGWRFLRVPTALYVLALVSALTGVVVFLTMDGVDRVVKVLVTIALGLGLILGAARRLKPRPPQA